MRILFLSANPDAPNPVLDDLRTGLEPHGAHFRTANFETYRSYFEKDPDLDRKAPIPPEVVFIDLNEDHDEPSLKALLYVSKQVQSVVYVTNLDPWQDEVAKRVGVIRVHPEEIPLAINNIRNVRTASSAPPCTPTRPTSSITGAANGDTCGSARCTNRPFTRRNSAPTRLISR